MEPAFVAFIDLELHHHRAPHFIRRMMMRTIDYGRLKTHISRLGKVAGDCQLIF